VSFLIADLVHVCVADPDDGLHNRVLIKDNIDIYQKSEVSLMPKVACG